MENFQKDYCSTIPTYHGNSKKRFHLKNTTKNSIKIADISRLLNTELGNLNDSSLILSNDRLSMYNTIYIFLKFACPICKTIELSFHLVQLKEGIRVSSVKNTKTGDPRHQTMTVNSFETINYFGLK